MSNFHPPEVVGPGKETQLQVSEKLTIFLKVNKNKAANVINNFGEGGGEVARSFFYLINQLIV